jgi:hypothetical protein
MPRRARRLAAGTAATTGDGNHDRYKAGEAARVNGLQRAAG